MSTTRRGFLKFVGMGTAILAIPTTEKTIEHKRAAVSPMIMGWDVDGADVNAVFVRVPKKQSLSLGEWSTVKVNKDDMPGMYVGKGLLQVYGPVVNLETGKGLT